MVRTVSVADRLSVVQSARYIRATRAGRSSGVEGGTMTASGDEQAVIKARALRTREGQIPALRNRAGQHRRTAIPAVPPPAARYPCPGGPGTVVVPAQPVRARRCPAAA